MPDGGFNEAAGIPRGRRRPTAKRPRPQDASMRPRVFPAEDCPVRFFMALTALSFNEAAGIPRGRLSARKRK